MIASQLQEGELYTKLRKTIFIGILNFNCLKRNSYHSVGKMKFEETESEEYINMGYKEEEAIASPFIEMHFIELPKFNIKNPEAKTKKDEWLLFLTGNKEMIEVIKKENKEIEKAANTLERISLDPKEREIYESIVQAEFNQKISNQKFLEEGIEEGKTEGKKQKGLEIAKKLLQKNMDIKTIEEITEIPEAEIKKLKEENKKTN